MNLRIDRRIPCVLYTIYYPEPGGYVKSEPAHMVICTTTSYRRAKKIKKQIEQFTYEEIHITELWHHPLLPRLDKKKIVDAINEVKKANEVERIPYDESQHTHY